MRLIELNKKKNKPRIKRSFVFISTQIPVSYKYFNIQCKEKTLCIVINTYLSLNMHKR